MVFEIQHPRSGVSALDVFPSLQELPSLAVRHCGVCHALKRVEAIDDRAVKPDRALAEGRPRRRALQVEELAVQFLPHFARDLLTHSPGVLAGEGDGGEDRVRVRFFESDEIQHRIRSRFRMEGFKKFAVLERGEDRQPLPATATVLILKIQHELHVHIQNARAGLRTLDVAAQPETGIGDATQHGSPSSRTQVSLLPPPCEEFTTSEPLRIATRVSPPGMMVHFSPMRM